MFINIECEVSTEQVVEKMLAQHSLNYVLWLILKTANYHSPEYLADHITARVEEVTE